LEVDLFTKYGGMATVEALVRSFYSDVLDSPTLSPFFKGYDVETIIQHQIAFISQVMGGPIQYKGRELGDAHYGLRITEAQFGDVAQLLHQNLEDYGVEESDIATIIGRVASTKDAVVNAG